MKAGKLTESMLSRSVLKQLHSRNERVKAGPGFGCDACAIQVGQDEAQVLSVDPVTLSGVHAGKLAVCHAFNDIAAMGAAPVGMLCSILLPTSSNETELRAIIKEMDEECAAAGAQILGGHTEVSRAVKEPLLTATGVGVAEKEALVRGGQLRPGMDLIVTKWIGLEGTAILATEREEQLKTRFSQPFLDKAQAFFDLLSSVPEAAVALKSGVSAMHDASQGGIFGALWEMAEAADVGLEIDLKKIPIRQETIEICEFFDINPYKLASQGAMLMAAQDGNALVRALVQADIPAAVIGKATDRNDRILLCDGERRFLETTQTDEMFRIAGTESAGKEETQKG
jgi:hydrogenase maturation factor